MRWLRSARADVITLATAVTFLSAFVKNAEALNTFMPAAMDGRAMLQANADLESPNDIGTNHETFAHRSCATSA